MIKQLDQNKLRQSTVLLTLGSVLLGATHSYGLGFLVPNQDAFAIGRGNAVAATADNPSAIYYNPAGITQIPGTVIQFGDLNYLGINVHYNSPNGASQANTKFEIVPIPELYFTHSISNSPVPISYGLGIYAPFGLGVKWPQQSSLRTEALNSRLYYITINPVIAVEPVHTLSFAVGPTFNYAKIGFNRGLTSAFDYYEFKGDAFNFGLTAGLMWKPISQLSFGLDYKLATDMNFSGTSTYGPGNGAVFSTGTTGDVHFPQILSGGISYRPTQNWNFEGDVDYINWNTLGNVNLHGTKNIFGQNLILALNWHDSWQFKFGATRYFGDGWYASAGYFYSTSTTSSEDYTAAVPDAGLHVGSIGVGRNCEHWHWSLATQLIGGTRSVPADPGNTNPFTGATSGGRYSFLVPTLAFSVGYAF